MRDAGASKSGARGASHGAGGQVMLSKGVRRAIALTIVAAIMAPSVPIEARWHDNSDNLPGIGGFPVVTVVIGAAAVVGTLIWAKHRKHAEANDPVRVPKVVNAAPDSTAAIKVENRGPSPVQLSEVVAKGYSLVDAPSLPVVIDSNKELELRLRADDAPRKGSVVLSILDGKRSRTRKVSIRPMSN